MGIDNIERTGTNESDARIECVTGHEPELPTGPLPKLSHQWAPPSLNVKLVEEQLTALRSSLICALNQLLDLKDLNTGVHSTRLAEWALHVAGELGLDRECLGDIEVGRFWQIRCKSGLAVA